jgi:integrase
MPKMHLTNSFVTNPPVPASTSKVNYFDALVPGFLMEVRNTGKATYYQRYRDKAGRLKQVRIGHTDSLSLDEARQKARYLRSQAVMGVDPNAEIERYKQSPTFKEFVEDSYLPHIMMHKRSWQQDEKLIGNMLIDLWGKMKMQDIDRQDVESFQSAIFSSGKKPSTVNRYMALVKYIFNLAERWQVIDKSPARNVGMLADNNHKERYLSDEETQKLLDSLKKTKSNVIPDIIEFLILTGARKGEVVGLRWEELDLDLGVWVLPPERNKANTNKKIPLSQAAINLLVRRRGNDSEYVFPNPKTGKPLKHLHKLSQ